jgi:hypothetical protein
LEGALKRTTTLLSLIKHVRFLLTAPNVKTFFFFHHLKSGEKQTLVATAEKFGKI